MQELWDLYPEIILDERGRVVPPRRKRLLHKDDPPDAFELLAEVVLESACTSAELNEIQTRNAFCLVVQVPGPEWVAPLAQEIRSRGEWDESVVRAAMPKARNDDGGIDAIAARFWGVGTKWCTTSSPAVYERYASGRALIVLVTPMGRFQLSTTGRFMDERDSPADAKML